jgi:UDP-N-acetylmuramate--alanine ligase
VAVAGTHGKTTTTSMLARVFFVAGLDPTVVIGGKLDAMGSGARLGAGEFMLAEADESDGSFLLLDPTVTVITNIDPEHMEHWGSMDALRQGFADFANKVPFYGFGVLCLDHPEVQRLIPRLRRRVITYGLALQAEVRGVDIRYDGLSTSFTALWRDQVLGTVTLGMPGEHNVRNALAALGVGLELGIPFEAMQAALDGFSGVDRRFSIRAVVPLQEGESPVTVIDDYGHHPVEIEATLAAARNVWPRQRIHAVFQPHRYSRVQSLLSDFARCFNAANSVLVCPIYRAGESPIEGLDQERIAEEILHHGHRSVTAVGGLEQATELLAAQVGPGDVVITLGAGDVNRVCVDLPERLRGQR